MMQQLIESPVLPGFFYDRIFALMLPHIREQILSPFRILNLAEIRSFGHAAQTSYVSDRKGVEGVIAEFIVTGSADRRLARQRPFRPAGAARRVLRL